MFGFGKPRPEPPVRTMESDEDFDRLEDYLDNLPKGPRLTIPLPAGWRFRWTARRQARIKKAVEAKGERYIEEVSYPVTRTLGVVGGWVSSVGTSDEEQAAIMIAVRPHFERYGLTVTQVFLAWTGMSVGGSGNYESYDLVVRLA